MPITEGAYSTYTPPAPTRSTSPAAAPVAPSMPAAPVSAPAAPTSVNLPSGPWTQSSWYHPNLNPSFGTALEQFLAASGGQVTVGNAYRTPERTEELWYGVGAQKYPDEEVRDNWYARPPSAGGRGSNHNRGLAADLQFANDAARQWAHANAAKYGLYFPMGHEPWHVELQGGGGGHNHGSGGPTDFTVPTYPTTPLPLTGDDFADLAARRRAGSRMLETAMARREAGRAEVELLFEQLNKRLGREGQDREEQLRDNLGDRGLAFTPRFMGQGLKDLQEWQAEEAATLSMEKAQRLAALEDMVRAAQEQRELDLLMIDADEARRRSELTRLLSSLGG